MNSTLGTLSITMNTTSQGLQDLSQQIQQVAISTGSSTQAVADAVKVYANFGESVDSIMAKTKAAIMLSNVSGLDTKQVTDSIHAILNEYQMGTQDIQKDSQHIADSLVAISKNMAMDFGQGIDEITKGIQVVGEVANQVGKQTSDQTEATLGAIIEKLRIGGEQAGNGLKTIISRIYQSKTIDPNVTDEDLSKTSAMLHQLGVSVMDATGAYRNLSDIFADIQKAEQGMTDSQKEAIAYQAAGVRQANIFATAIDTVGKAQTLTNAAISSSGELYNANAKYMDTISARMKVLSATMSSMWLNTINSNVIKDSVSGVTELISTFGNLKTALAVVATGFAIFKGTEIFNFFKTFDLNAKLLNSDFLVLGASAAGFSQAEVAAMSTTDLLALSVRGLGVAIASNPIGLIVTGITLAIGAMDIFNQKTDEAIQKQQETTQTYQDQQTTLNSIIQSYQQNAELAKTDDTAKTNLLNTEKQLKDTFGQTASAIDLQNGKIDDNIKKLQDLSVEQTKDYIAKQKAYALDAQNDMSNKKTYDAAPWNPNPFSSNSSFAGARTSSDMSLQEAINYYKDLLNQLNNNVFNDPNANHEAEQVSAYLDKLQTQLKNDQNSVDSLNQAYKNLAQNSVTGLSDLSDAQLKVYDQIKNNLSYTNQDQYKKNLQDTIDVLKSWDGKNLDDVSGKLQNIDASLSPVGKDAQTAKQQIDSVAFSLDNYITTSKKAQQEIDDYNNVLAELNNGHQVAGKEIATLIEKYPGFINVVKEHAGVLGIDRNALEDLINTTNASKDATINAEIEKTNAVIKATQDRIDSYVEEAKSLSALGNALVAVDNMQPGNATDQARQEHLSIMKNGGANAQFLADAQLQLQDAKSKLAELQKYKDIMSSPDLGVTSSASKTATTPTSETSAQADILSAQIRSYNYTYEQDKLQDSLLQKQISTAKTAKDYNTELQKTNDLLTVQQKEITDLQTANKNIENEKNNVKAQYPQFNTSSWFDSNGNSTVAYETDFQNASAKTQKSMKTEFDALSKLNKAQQDNNNTIQQLNTSIDDTKQSLPQLNFNQVTANIQTFTDSINESNTQLDLSKARMDALNTTSPEYTQELTNQVSIYKALIAQQQASIGYMQSELNDTNLSTDAKQQLTKQIEEGTKALLGYQKALNTDNPALFVITQQYDAQQKQNTELQKSLDLQLKITEAEDPKNYDAINVILNSQISAQQTNLSQIQSTIDSLIQQRDLLDQSSSEWQKINDQVTSYQSTLDSSYQTLMSTYKSQLDNSINQQLQKTELSIFGGQTEAEAKQALQDQTNYNNEYITGAEKAATVLLIQNQVLQDNASLNNGIVGLQGTQIQLTQQQMALLNSSSDIKRSDLDILEKQLAIQKTQAELNNASNQKADRILVGNSWTWQADQTKVLQLQGQLYQEQVDLAKTQIDDQNKDQQTLLNQKSEYYNNIKTVVQNGLNGEYTDFNTFQNKMNGANTSFLNTFQGTNQTYWQTISSDTSTNINNMLSSYQSYVQNMATLQATLNQIKASSSTTPLKVPNVAGSQSNTGTQVVNNSGNSVNYSLLPSSGGAYKISQDNSGNTVYTDTKSGDIYNLGGGAKVPLETKATGGIVGGGDANYTAVSLMDIANGKYINSEKPILAKPGELILNTIQQSNLYNGFQNLLNGFQMPSAVPISSNPINNNDNSITIQNLNVTAQNANDLVSNLRHLARVTNVQYGF